MTHSNCDDDDGSNLTVHKTKTKNKKKVSFSELVTVLLLDVSFQERHDGAHALPFREHRRRRESTSTAGAISTGNGAGDASSSPDPSAPLANTEGLVAPERRMHQRQAILAILSYRQRIRRMTKQMTNTAPSVDVQTLLSRASCKFSRRAKDIALEIARLNRLEVEKHVMAQSSSSSSSSSEGTKLWSVPIPISDFPTIRQKERPKEREKEKRCRSDDGGLAENDRAAKPGQELGWVAAFSSSSSSSLEASVVGPLEKRSRGNAAA
ncbi:hypothetical protein ACHAXS_005017 [Conticribra weissflogii]